MDSTILWIYEQRDMQVTDADIRKSLQASGWTQKQIEEMMSEPRPKQKKFNPRRTKLVLFAVVMTFMLLVFLLFMLSLGFIGDNKVAFTLDRCLEREVPDSACQSMQAFIDSDSDVESWISPATIATFEGPNAIDKFTLEDPFIDLGSWYLNGTPSDGTALVCVESTQTKYLLLLSNATGQWFVDSLLELDEDGSTTIFGSASFCEIKI